MGRPPGSKNKPGGKKPGLKAGSYRLPQFTVDQILTFKAKILGMLEDGTAFTLTEAAEKLGIPPTRVHNWSTNDKDFQDMFRLARQVRADILESELAHHKNFIPQMFILKAYRPEFRENYKLELVDSKLRELLEELRKAGKEESDDIRQQAGNTQEAAETERPD